MNNLAFQDHIMGPIANTVKKGLQKLRNGYLNCKPLNERSFNDYNVSDHSNEESIIIAKSSDDISATTSPTEQCSSSSEGSTRKSSGSSRDSLDGLTDSGISEENSPPKKVQFAPALVHEYKTNTPYRKRRRSSRSMSDIGLCTVKYGEVAVPRKVQIIDLSPKHVVGIVTSADYVNPGDHLQSPSSTYSLPVGTKPPPKPPRSAEKLKTITSDSSSSSTDDNTRRYNRRTTFGGRKRFAPLQGTNAGKVKNHGNPSLQQTNHLISSSSLDLEDVDKMMSSPKSPRSIRKSEPIYAEVFPRSSQNTSLSDSSTLPPRSLETTPASSESSIVKTADSQDFLPDATSTVYNEVLIKGPKAPKEAPPDHNKFVINMFESRPSKRWEKHLRATTSKGEFNKNSFIRMSFDSKTMDHSIGMLEKEFRKLETESRQINNDIKRMTRQDRKESVRTRLGKQNEDSNVKNWWQKDQFRRYRMLKECRDVECSRMAQASKALEEIKFKKSKADWMEILVAEKVLLETSERVNLYTQQIREASYAIIPEEPLHKGTLHLSNVKFPFIKSFQQKYKADKHFTDFFLMTMSHGTKLYVSEFITGEEDPLSFQHQYTFPNVAPDFEIVVKLFCLKLRTSEEFFWQKFTCSGCCPTSKIIYEDQLTHEYQEKAVFKTSFRLCAEATLTNSQINEPSTRLMIDPQVFDRLKGTVEHCFVCDDVDMAVSISGFLDVGTLFGETYFWERKWCALKGSNLLIYNYPQEEDFGRPVEQINLEYCFGPIVTKVDNCPRRRCFQLNTGRPNDVVKNRTGTASTTLRSNPNFTLRKFYFAARDGDGYLRWVTEVGKLLHSLSYFKKLVFDEEYYDCLMN